MKNTTFLNLCATAIVSLGALTPAIAATPAEARKVYNDHKSSIYGVKGILKLNITFQGQAKEQEAPIWSNATCIDNGLFVVAYNSISPDVNVGNRPGVEINKQIEELKLVNSSGEEFDAKLVLHDEDLGLAFIAIDPKAENNKDWKGKAVDISKDPILQHFDETITIARENANMRFQAAAQKGSVSTIIQKPRTFYKVRGAAMSAPTFNEKGEFVGITVAKKSAVAGQSAVPVTVPAKYIRGLAEQAKAKQAELAK